jgi:hypothetical protein
MNFVIVAENLEWHYSFRSRWRQPYLKKNDTALPKLPRCANLGEDMIKNALAAAIALAMLAMLASAHAAPPSTAATAPSTWTPDNGDGTFTNPIVLRRILGSRPDPRRRLVLPDRHHHAHHAGPADPALEGPGQLGIRRLRAGQARPRPGLPAGGWQGMSTVRVFGRRPSATTTASSTSSRTSTGADDPDVHGHRSEGPWTRTR